MNKITTTSVILFLLTNVVFTQDIINETGKDGKFIVRDAEQKEALIVEDGNLEVIGELKINTMTEGDDTDAMVVWDKDDKSLKVVPRVFSKVSPLSEKLDTGIGHSIIRGNPLDEDGNEISASVQGIAAVIWNQFDTDYGYIKLGPATPFAAHIYSQQKFIFNKEIRVLNGRIGSHNTDLYLKIKGRTKVIIDKDNGNVGIGTLTPDEKLHIAGNMRLDGTFEDEDGEAGTNGQILSATATGTNWITAGGGSADNLGDHTATQDLDMAGFEINLNGGYLSGDGDEEGVYVDIDGNVGIGSLTPDEKLHVAGNLRLDGTFEDEDGESGTNGQILSATATGTNWITAGGGSADNLGDHTATQDLDMAGFEINLNGGYLSGDGDEEGVSVDIDGNVGIGTATPDEKLHVAGNMRLDGTFEDKDGEAGTSGQILSSTGAGTGTNWIDSPSGADNLGDHTATDILDMAGFEINLNGGYLSGDGDEEGIFVDVDGNVGFGTASPQGKVDIESTDGALIVPRMTTAQRGILPTVNGSIIYNTSTDQFNFYENGSWVAK